MSYTDRIREALDSTIDIINFPEAKEHFSGKVRETFLLPNENRAIVVTDRISSFDVVWGTVPFKGQVLNQIAAWWFRRLDGIIPHHLLDTPDPNISLVRNARVLPVEIVVRGYLTGSTSTSAWHHYQHCDRKICGIEMPEGMKKSQKFDTPILTPTTKPVKATEHDRPISRAEIISEGLVSEEIYTKAEEYALTMFRIGQEVAAERGLILVDTKYEMGITPEGELIVIDEVHTPDSSRYWIADSYQARFEAGEEPDKLDKEFFRLMILEAGFDKNMPLDQVDPKKYMSDEIRVAAAEKYIQLYEHFTGEKFQFPEEGDSTARIEGVLTGL